MSNNQAFAAIEYEAESSAANWAEAVTTFGTHRIPHLGVVDTGGLSHPKEAAGYVEQYRYGGNQHVLMGQDGTIDITLDLAGHGATTAGSPTLDPLETFLGIPFGNVALSAAASTTLSGGTAAVPTTAASGTFSAGGLCCGGAGPVGSTGAAGDARGGGQMYAIATHVTTTLTLLNALIGAPTNGDVLYPVAQMYLPTSPTTTDLVGTRFQVLTGNMQYRLHGCFPTKLVFTGLSPGERPQVKTTWRVSRWYETAAGTFPSVLTSNRYLPAPTTAGSLHANIVGTATRQTFAYRNFQLEVDLGIQAMMGPGGVGQYQAIAGAKRVDGSVKLSFVVDADATTATPFWPGLARGTQSLMMMLSLSTAIGSRVGFKMPKVCISDAIPVQIGDNKINRFKVTAMAYAGDTLTNELTRSPLVMGYA
jgi:hypothetical protein